MAAWKPAAPLHWASTPPLRQWKACLPLTSPMRCCGRRLQGSTVPYRPYILTMHSSRWSPALPHSSRILMDHLRTSSGVTRNSATGPITLETAPDAQTDHCEPPPSDPLQATQSTLEYSSTQNLLRRWLEAALVIPERQRSTISYLFKGTVPPSSSETAKAPPLCSPHWKPGKPRNKPCNLFQDPQGYFHIREAPGKANMMC